MKEKGVKKNPASILEIKRTTLNYFFEEEANFKQI